MPELQIIFEDENVLVINKPAGLVVHKDERGQPEDTLLDRLIKKYPQAQLVHRLDKDTSGVMIIAKNQEIFEFLKNQFQTRQVKKIYHAILSGNLKLEVGEEKILDLPIGRSKNDPRKRLASKNADGLIREAITVFRLLENLGTKYSYVEIELKTGRTHQIRVHFKAYSHPVIGDSLYNPNDNGVGAIKRQALHASKLTIRIPNGNKDEIEKEYTFEAPLPSDFTKALEKLRVSC